MQAQIDIPEDVAAELYRRAPKLPERSALLGKILREYFSSHHENVSELDILNGNSEELNREAADVLDYQVLR
jgi:hypothetical protein